MVEFLVLCVLVGGACSLYESGKKTGSMASFNESYVVNFFH